MVKVKIFFDVAARAVAELCKHEPHLYKLVFVGAPKGEEKVVEVRHCTKSTNCTQLQGKIAACYTVL